MARFKVPETEGWIEVFDGEAKAAYRIENGEIEVPDNHAQAIVAGVPGAVRIIEPESPVKSIEPASPVKE